MTDINTRALDRELKRGSRPEGRRVLAQQRKTWAAFVEAVRRVTGDDHA
jgi:hypothetical protein